MRTLYFDCSMGAAGDMLTAALLELLPEPDKFVERLNSLGIPKVRYIRESAQKCGITGTHMKVTVDGEEEHEHTHHREHHEHHHEYEHHHGHHHTSLHDIEHIVSHLDISEKVKQDVLAVYSLIAEAESHAHGKPIDQIHFHEVGTMDAVADVTAVCLLIEELSPQRITASAVHVGSGSVHCAHGILPVPAPATAYILRDVPVYGGSIDGELCTPTGAALLKHFVNTFGDMPVMRVSGIGYGMGKKDLERANCVRAMLGESDDESEQMYELACNVDDMTAEDIAFACEELFRCGANEVYTVPAGMKKSRSGIVINVICTGQKREQLIRVMFKHTSTLGIRESKFTRHILDRKIETVQTQYGDIRTKVSEGYGVRRIKFEHDDLERIARENGESIGELRCELCRGEKNG
ncbi:MAG: nickel pincer cofactor biosynthesis protein LarC [Ruminococcus sp.]|nr:nickel pincer cofactor biosynthesis protein LarC [Ruminococcus sp.]